MFFFHYIVFAGILESAETPKSDPEIRDVAQISDRSHGDFHAAAIDLNTILCYNVYNTQVVSNQYQKGELP